MKRYLFTFLMLSLSICSHSQNKTECIIFNEFNSKAVLIGEKIELLDNDLRRIDDISSMSGEIVSIVGVSDSLFNQYKDICEAFWYVKIKSKDMEGVVNGRQVFEMQGSDQDTVFTVNGNRIEILTTNFLGMGVDYNGDLMGCPVDQPIVIKDSKNSYFGLVNLIQNDYSEKARGDREYPFFELRSDDGRWDRIVSIIADGTKIRLKIHRRYQEGENDYEVLLTYQKDKYIAEYLSFGEIKYE